MDAVVIGTYTKHTQHYLARGDVANTPFKRWLLGKQLHIIPIYRLQEGSDQLHKNEATFNICNKLLKARQSLIIFPEGICVQEQRLQKLRKGIARIAFGAEEAAAFDLNLKIIPIGLNYEAQRKFRSKLFIEIGEPIAIADYLNSYKTDKARAMNAFTNDLELKMRELIVSVNDADNDAFVNHVFEVYRPELMANFKDKKDILEKEHRLNQKIAAAVNYFHNSTTADLTTLKTALAAYNKKVRALNLRDHLLRSKAIGSLTVPLFIRDYAVIVAGAPLHIAGLVGNYLPYRLGYVLAKKIAKKKEFHASVCIVMGTFAWLFYYAFQLLAVAILFHNSLVLIAYACIVPLLGLFSINYYFSALKIFGRWRLLRMVKTNKDEIEKLIQLRYLLIKEMDNFKDLYLKSK